MKQPLDAKNGLHHGGLKTARARVGVALRSLGVDPVYIASTLKEATPKSANPKPYTLFDRL